MPAGVWRDTANPMLIPRRELLQLVVLCFQCGSGAVSGNDDDINFFCYGDATFKHVDVREFCVRLDRRRI